MPPRELRQSGDFDALAYHFVELSVGTPPRTLSAILDTGSALFAVPCDTCRECAPQHRRFAPSNSSSSAAVACGKDGPHPTSPPYCTSCNGAECRYSRSFSEGSTFGGRFVRDWVALGAARVQLQLGCHGYETGLFGYQEADGVLGFSGGPLSLPSALGHAAGGGAGAVLPFSLCASRGGGVVTLGGGDARLRVAGGAGGRAPLTLTPTGLYTVEVEGARWAWPR